MPVAPAEHRPTSVERIDDDAGTDRQHAGRPARRTEAAAKLQEAGLIRYSYGHIDVLDRPGLEKRVCECYAVVKSEFDRLLPDLTAL